MYKYKIGDPFSYKNAAEWYQKAADQGDSKGQFELGQMYYKGTGVPQDYKQALKWYQKSAEQGDAG